MNWCDVFIECPVCDSKGKGRAAGGWLVDGQDSDLLVRVKGLSHPILVELHTCNVCGYSGLLDDFRWTWTIESHGQQWHRPPEISIARKEAFLSDVKRLYCNVKGKNVNLMSHAGYVLAHRCAEMLGADDLHLAKLFVRAYWCLRFTPFVSREFLDEKAQAYLAASIRILNRIMGKGKPPSYVTYLAGELCRRSGKFEGAAAYLRLFMKREDAPEYLIRAAQRLLIEAEKGNCEHMSMESLLYVP